MSNTFEVVFSGEVLDGFDPAETRAKIGKLFNADEAKVTRLFSGNSIVIKKDLDEATANKYLGAFKNAGAKAVVRNTAASEASFEPTPATESTPKPVKEATPTPAAKVKPKAGAVDSSVFEHSGEASAHLTAAPKPQVELDSNPDLSGLSLKEGTGNLVDPSEEIPEANFDTSEFSLAATGSDLAEKKEEAEEYNPDLSGISIVDN